VFEEVWRTDLVGVVGSLPTETALLDCLRGLGLGVAWIVTCEVLATGSSATLERATKSLSVTRLYTRLRFAAREGVFLLAGVLFFVGEMDIRESFDRARVLYNTDWFP
jgi:hypothetical protein